MFNHYNILTFSKKGGLVQKAFLSFGLKFFKLCLFHCYITRGPAHETYVWV